MQKQGNAKRSCMIFWYHLDNVPLEKATIETLQCSSLLESSQGQICEISCVILRKRGCLRSFGFPGSWWGGAGA